MDKKVRYNGIDIIKVLAIIFVPLLHFFINYDFGEIKMLHVANVIQIGIRWLAFSCIGLFIMCSGYLLSNKKVTKKYYKKIIYFLFIYFVAFNINFIITKKFYGNSNYFIDYLISFFKFNGYFWYVPFYISLYCLIPYLNMVIEKLEKKSYLIFLGILISLTVLPNFVNAIPPLETIKILYLPGSFGCLWPGVYYFIGAYFKKFQPNYSRRKAAFIMLVALTFISCLNFTYSRGESAFFTGGGYGNIISVVVCTCIFAMFYRINLKKEKVSKVFKFISGITFETYLSLGVSDIYTRKIINHLTNNGFVEFKYILIEVPVNFLIAFIVGIGIHYFIKLITKVFNLKLS